MRRLSLILTFCFTLHHTLPLLYPLPSPSFSLSPTAIQCIGESGGIRLNKAFKQTHSRREADKLISSGRVLVNGSPPTGAGDRLTPYEDVVTLDGKRVNFEELNVVNPQSSNTQFSYVKFWKPRGVICTTDQNVPNNIITDLTRRGLEMDSRLYPVGRLDKDTHGVILLTNDGRLPNASLRSKYMRLKVYVVTVDYDLTEDDIRRLREGIVITTVAQRDGKKIPLTAATMPCEVEVLESNVFRITLKEGRNRQIRKMCKELDLEVLELKRVSFMGISDSDMKVGEWRYLDSTEIEIVEAAVEGWDVEDGGDVRGEAEEESEEEDKELRAWSISDVQAWLRSKGYGRYTEQFKEEGVDGNRLLYLGTPDQVDHLSWVLEEVGVVEEDRLKLEGEIVKLCEERG